MTISAGGEEGTGFPSQTIDMDFESAAMLTIPLVGFVFSPSGGRSRSFQAEGTWCEIGSWQVNEVFRRCEKPSMLVAEEQDTRS